MLSRANLLIFMVAAGLQSVAMAQVSPLRVRVEQTSKSDTIGYKSVQSRRLNVIISNSASAPADVKVKYVIFGRDIQSKEVVAIARSEMPATVPASGTTKLETAVAQAAAEEARIGSKGKSEAI